MTEVDDTNIEELKYGHIYKITNIINEKVYIGRTVNNDKISRWDGKTIKSMINGYGFNGYLIRSVRKYGVKNFIQEIIEDNISLEELCKRENHWINFYNSINSDKGYNLICGEPYVFVSEETRKKLSNASKDRQVTKETRIKMSESKVGDKNPMKRPEVRIKHKKAVNNPESKRKLSENNCMHRPEIRKKVGESLKGKIPWNKGIKTGSPSKEHKKKHKDAVIKVHQEHPEIWNNPETNKKRSETLKKLYKEHPEIWKQSHTEETRKKRSESMKGKIPWNKGKKMTDEYCRKNSEAQKRYYQEHPEAGKKKGEELKKYRQKKKDTDNKIK